MNILTWTVGSSESDLAVAIGQLLIPSAIWFISPLWGFGYLLKVNYTISQLLLVTAPIGIIINTLGYLIGLLISKIKKA